MYLFIYSIKNILLSLQNADIYMYISIKKHTQNLLKLQISLFFSEALAMHNKVTNENADNSAT